MAPNVVDVTVTTPGGTSAISAADDFSCHRRLSRFLQPSDQGHTGFGGSTAGGNAVTITGTNASGRHCELREHVGTQCVTCATATSCNGSTPGASSVGVVDVTVTTTGGTSAKSAADQLAYLYPHQVVGEGGPGPACLLSLPLFNCRPR